MNNPSKEIAVLGAGPMGLAVAYQLVKEGYRPIIFEADDRVGGMAAAFNFDGLPIERYYHFHCVSDHAFLQLLNELNLQDKMHWKATKMGYFYQGRLFPWGNPLALLQFPSLSLIEKFRYGLHAFLCTKRKNWKPLDQLPAIPWIKRWIGQHAYEVLWSKLFDYKFYEYSNTISAAWIWSRIHRIGRSRYNMFSEKLGYLEGGSDTLLQAMRHAIESQGGVFRLQTPVSKIVIEQDQVKGIEALGEFIAFNKVIGTIPLPYIPKLLPDLPHSLLQAYQSVKNIAVVCIIVKLKKSITGNFWLNINDPNMDIPGLIEYSNLRPLNQTIVYIPFYMPGEHPKFQEPDQNFLNKAKHYLKRIKPDLVEDDFIALHASRYRFAQPICEPGHLEKLPPVQLPIQGLWVADTSYYYPDDRGISESVQFGRNMAKQAIL